jgi:hypothetical protein
MYLVDIVHDDDSDDDDDDDDDDDEYDTCTFMVMVTDNLSYPLLMCTLLCTPLCRQRGGKVREDEVCGYLVGTAENS